MRCHFRISLMVGNLLVGMGLLLIVATIAIGLVNARQDPGPSDRIENQTQSNKGFDPIIIPDALMIESQDNPIMPMQTSELMGDLQSTSPPHLWEIFAAGEQFLSTPTSVPVWLPDRIAIPAIELDAPVDLATIKTIKVQGQPYQQWVAPDAFVVGLLTTSAPLGSTGNTVLIGHHNTYGEVFARLVDLHIGDLILMYSGNQNFTYEIVLKMIIQEASQPIAARLRNALWVAPSQDERLTLVTCWPHTSNTHRLIIVATPVNLENIPR